MQLDEKLKPIYKQFLKTDKFVCYKCQDSIEENIKVDAFENYCRTKVRMKYFQELLNSSQDDVKKIFCPKLCICNKDKISLDELGSI